jgi:hypothetical protein
MLAHKHMKKPAYINQTTSKSAQQDHIMLF